MEDGILNEIAGFRDKIAQSGRFNDQESLMILKSYVDSLLISSEPRECVDRETSKPNGNGASSSGDLISKGKTLAELVRLTNTKQHPDIVLLAIYVLLSMKVDSVTISDIEQQYSSAMLKASANTNATINLNRKKGYLMEGEKREGKMTFRMTLSGIDYVENLIKGTK
jgi:hypothetical protein